MPILVQWVMRKLLKIQSNCLLTDWVWEETGAPGANPRRHGDNEQALHRQKEAQKKASTFCREATMSKLTTKPPCCPRKNYEGFDCKHAKKPYTTSQTRCCSLRTVSRLVMIWHDLCYGAFRRYGDFSKQILTYDCLQSDLSLNELHLLFFKHILCLKTGAPAEIHADTGRMRKRCQFCLENSPKALKTMR